MHSLLSSCHPRRSWLIVLALGPLLLGGCRHVSQDQGAPTPRTAAAPAPDAVLAAPAPAAGSPEELVKQGEEALSRDDFLKAAEFGFRARQANPKLPGAYNLIGVVYARTRQPVEGRKFLRRAVELGPNLLAPRVNLARLELQENRPSQAFPQLEAAGKLAPKNPEVWLLLARALRAQNNHASAEDAFRRCLALDPNAAEAEAGLGLMEIDVNHYPVAVTHLNAAVRLGDHSPLTLCCLALSLLASTGTEADAARATELLNEAGHPPMPPAWYAEGLLAKRKRDYPAARASFEKMLQTEPRNEPAWFALAEVCRLSGDTAAAERALRQHHRLLQQRQTLAATADRLKAEGARPSLLKRYGQALLATGRAAEAEKQFRLWAGMAPHDPEARQWIVRAHAAAGNPHP